LTQGRDLHVIPRRTRMYGLTGIDTDWSQSRVNWRWALCAPCTENFHWASHIGAWLTAQPSAVLSVALTQRPRSLRERRSRLTLVGSPDSGLRPCQNARFRTSMVKISTGRLMKLNETLKKSPLCAMSCTLSPVTDGPTI
jgi:hypothetical protein